MNTLLRKLLLLSLVSLAPCLGLLRGAETTASGQPTNPAGFNIRRGTNLSHWLSQDFGWAPRKIWITETDLRFIARAGFDHVRLPIDEKELWQEDGKRNDEAFALLQTAISWARANHLRVIVDLHTVRAHHFNAANEGLTNTLWSSPKAQENFLRLWRDLSAALHDQPVNAVAYEIMNEPVADNAEDWNKLIAASVAAIRALEPNRVLVIGSNRWQGPETFPLLKVPVGDKNIILSTHYYGPLPLTHHKADWTQLKNYTGPIHYPGNLLHPDEIEKLNNSGDVEMIKAVKDHAGEWNAERFQQQFAPAITRARELGLQLYCGEFGCLPTIDRVDRLTYYRDLISILERNGMAWANWEYKGDFGLFEWFGARYLTGAPDYELIDALLSGRKATPESK
jgi:endoglucanase